MISKFRLFVLVLLALPIVLLNIGGCSNGSSSERVRISGFVLSVDGNPNAVQGIRVTAINPDTGKTLGGSGAITGADGGYSLRVPTKGQTRVIILTFTTPDLQVFDEDFVIGKGSEVFLDVSLAGDGNVNIAAGDYQVVSRQLSVESNRDYIFVNALGITTPGLADLTIEGGGNNCIRTTGTSAVVIGVRNFTMTNCNFGIRSTNSSSVTIDASEDFAIESGSNGVNTQVNATVFLSGVNDFTIESFSAPFAIRAENNSTVTVNDGIAPPMSCLIEGTEGIFIVNDVAATVDLPANCLLVVEPL